MLIKVNNGIFISVDVEKKTVEWIDKAVIKAELDEARLRKADVKVVTDEELLTWARGNYPFEDNSEEQAHIREIIAKNVAILDEIKEL